MFCIKCGGQIPENSAFCPICGAPAVRSQSNYRQPNPQSVHQQHVQQQAVYQQYQTQQQTLVPGLQHAAADQKKRSTPWIIAAVSVVVALIAVGAALYFALSQRCGNPEPSSQGAALSSSGEAQSDPAGIPEVPSENTHDNTEPIQETPAASTRPNLPDFTESSLPAATEPPIPVYTETEPTPVRTEPIKVGIIHLDPSESGYRQANVKDLKNTFSSENGYDATFVTAPTFDRQLNAARDFITNEVEYILVSAAETTGWDEVLADAQEAGIKVFLFDRMIDCDPSLYTAAVVSDMRQEGVTAVAWLESLNLDEYKILHIQGQPGSAAQIGRSDPLTEKCAADDKWTIVREGTGGDSWDPNEARKIAEAAIDAGESFNIVYAENDGMADGVVQALDAKGITHGVNGDVIIMGFDCNKWALEKLKSGEWNYDGQCSPFQAAVIDQMIKTLEAGKAIEGLNDLNQIISEEKGFDARTITQADIDAYGLGD